MTIRQNLGMASRLTMLASTMVVLLAVFVAIETSHATPTTMSTITNFRTMLGRFFFHETIIEPTSSTCLSDPYQSYDGSCNNLFKPDQGKVGNFYKHVVAGDWNRPVMSGELPDSRLVSRTLQNSVSQRKFLTGPGMDPLGTTFAEYDEEKEPNGINSLFVEFGQFVNHDLELNKNTDPADIKSEFPFANVTQDPLFFPFPTNNPSNPFNPAGLNVLLATDSVGETKDGKFLVTNLANSYLDLSNIYGTDSQTNKALRTLSGGLLVTGKYVADGGVYAPEYPVVEYENVLPSTEQTGIATGVFNTLNTLFESPSSHSSHQQAPFADNITGVSGDPRAIENIFLATQHTIWMREHNRIANIIASSAQGKTLSDEQIFQTARRINIAQYQNVIYKEFVPLLVSDRVPRYNGYNPIMDATTSVEFASAALRYGHSNVGDVDIKSCDETPIGIFNKTMLSTVFNLNAITSVDRLSYNGAAFTFGPGLPTVLDFSYPRMLRLVAGVDGDPIDNLVTSAIVAVAAKTDLSISNILTTIPGADLAALDIARGRRNAVAGYNVLRAEFGDGDVYHGHHGNPCKSSDEIDSLDCFAKVSSDVDVQKNLQVLYGKVSKIDAIIGMLAEDLPAGAHVGKTLGKVLLQEFVRKRDGDRFYVPWGSEVVARLSVKLDRELVKVLVPSSVTYSDIIARNTGIRQLSADVFHVPQTRPMPQHCSIGQNTLIPGNEKW
ncbi:hypothetical protein HDU76_002529 [Blyttiomyces sp. JEL0837]|nr:hypothetical protein HDU76_002529 [Blyttiomyces sp. JEL0837]